MIEIRPVRIAVCTTGMPNDEIEHAAEQVGMLIGRAKAVLVTGGLFGGMEAASRGARAVGGTTIGVLPGVNPDDANDYIQIPLATGLGEARNAVLVRCADSVIAIGGDWGTLSEIALAKKIGRPVVILMPSQSFTVQVPVADSPEQAVQIALGAARR